MLEVAITKISKPVLLETDKVINVKNYHFHYTVNQKPDVRPLQDKRLALQLYLGGLDFRAIGRILKISYEIVYQ